MTDLDPEKEIDGRVAELSTVQLYGLFLAAYQGFTFIEAMRSRAKKDKNPDLKATSKLVEKGVRAALADMHTMLVAVDERKKARKGQFKLALPSDELAELKEKDFSNADLLLSFRARLDAGWNKVPAEVRKKGTKDLKMIGVAAAGTTPNWNDLLEVFGELLEIDNDGGEGESVEESKYEALLDRFQNAETRKAAGGASGQTLVAPRKPGPDDEIIKYSPKSTFELGQFVGHPKFGTGTVIEAAEHVVVQFEEGLKRLAHVQQFRSLTPDPPKKTSPKTTALDVQEAAKKQGIEITKLPPVPTGDD